jgi:hypothetical protein
VYSTPSWPAENGDKQRDNQIYLQIIFYPYVRDTARQSWPGKNGGKQSDGQGHYKKILIYP